ncbi:MAG: DinB family protein [Acidobacteria bacterium]|nr:DinB family protein [Acidobacteriota bacterium]
MESRLHRGRSKGTRELTAHAGTVAIVRASLAEVFAEVDAWFERPADVRGFRPVSGGWTIDQVLEHISLTNHFLMLTLRKAVEKALGRAARGEPVPAGESDLQRLQAIGQRGSFPWVRPAHMEPTGRTTSGEVRTTLRRQVEECMSLLERMNHGEGALCRLHMSVNRLGTVDLYQWLYFLAQHARRHLQQMAAIEQELSSSSRAG